LRDALPAGAALLGGFLMQTNVLITLFFLLVTPLTCRAQDATEWVKYGSTAGSFSVLFPQHPKSGTRVVTLVSGEKVTYYDAEYRGDDGSSFEVSFGDVPSEIDAQKWFDTIKAESPEAKSGGMLREYQITLDGYPGREYMIWQRREGGDFIVQTRLYAVGRRSYFITYAYPKSLDPVVAARNAVRFFDSFRLVGVARTEEIVIPAARFARSLNIEVGVLRQWGTDYIHNAAPYHPRTPNEVEYQFRLEKGGDYELLVELAAEQPRPVNILVNGVMVYRDVLNVTTGTWHQSGARWFSVGRVNFRRGDNSLVIHRDDVFPHIVRLRLTSIQ
jgi:hypothetical protein